MSTVPLPAAPNLEHLRKQAKDLQRAVRAEDPDAVTVVTEHHPHGPAATAAFPLESAQLVVARRYGFASWPRLKRHVETITRLLAPKAPFSWSWTPEYGYQARPNQVAEDDVRRCRQAAAHLDPAGWRPLMTTHSNGVTLVAFDTPAGPLFCELTPTTVTVSQPVSAVVGGDRARLLFHTRLGSLAGVAGPDVEHLRLERPADRLASANALVANGIFLVPNAFPVTAAGLVTYANDNRTGDVVPAADLPRQAVAVVDRPQPKVDRTSPEGQWLGVGIAEADCPPVVDPDLWTPGAHLELTDTEQVQLGRYGTTLLACYRIREPEPDDQDLFVRDLDPTHDPAPYSSIIGDTISATRVYYDFRDGRSGTIAVIGLVQDDKVASITLRTANAPDVEAVIAGGTFVLAGPALTANGSIKASRVTVRDEDGMVLEEYPVSLVN